MTRTARGAPSRRTARWVTHPGCTAGVLVVLFVALTLLGLDSAARALALLVGVLTVVPVSAVLLASPPLPKLQAHSLLTERLAWLWRYGVATFVLSTAGVLSVYFSNEFTRQDSAVDRQERLIIAAAEVAQAAMVLGAFIFMIWLVVDLARLGVGRRYGAITVALRKLRLPTGGRLVRWTAFATRPWWVFLVLAVLLAPVMALEFSLGE